MASKQADATSIDRLLQIMAQLRDRDNGCAWDVEQTFETIAPYTIEEAYEVADAISQGDLNHLRDELGDLLLQVVFHARMAEEQDAFDFGDVVRSISDKMVLRHPHIYGDAANRDSQQQILAWEAQKAQERAKKANDSGKRAGVLDDVALGLPALMRAYKLQKRAARTGFDWPDVKPVTDKLAEELGELDEALKDPANTAQIHEEIGDVLFTVVNLARHLKVEPEEALRDSNRKFQKRFELVEKMAHSDHVELSDCDLNGLEEYWRAAKKQLLEK